MGWDVMMVKPYDRNDNSLNEEKMYSFSKKDAIESIKSVFGIKEIEDEDWIDYENSDFSISFDLSSEKSIMLYTGLLEDDGEKNLISKIKLLSEKLDCKAFDTAEAEFIF
ncbi:MAG: hypothetical protein IJ306_05920 [Oscillospiraceae bacterium]|nr:hypothetical protein [Oscillospiraceae bacterium]